MGAMYRLKAYFGMVPAEEMGAYVEDSAADRYADHRRERTVREYADERWDDRFTYDDEPERADRFERPERMDRHERPDRPDRNDRNDRYDDDWDRRPPRPMVPERPRAGGPPGPSAVRGALAIDPESALREPVRPVPSVVPEQRERPVAGAAALARITTLQPRSYREARTIGERYRAGQPVIMNLTELDAAEAKRLVDFAAGLVFALHGGFDKVTNRVFLLTPADVEVSADDARMLAERGILRAD